MDIDTALTVIASSDITYNEPVDPSPLDKLIVGWLHAKRQKSGSPKTYKAYSDTLAQFRAALNHQSIDLDAQDGPSLATIALTAQAFSSWSSIPGREVKSTTINQRLAILSSFYVYAIRQVALTINPIDRVERSKVQAYASAQPLTADHTTASLAAIDRSTLVGKRDYALVSLLLQTGRRLAEVEAVNASNLLLTTGKLTVTFERCKGNEIMYDILPYSVSNAILDWLTAFYGESFLPGASNDKRPVWVSLVNRSHKGGSTHIGDPLGAQSIADICKRRVGTSKVHATRHTWSHRMDELGASASTIQARLGHKSLATTGRYLAQLKSADNPLADKLAADLGIE